MRAAKQSSVLHPIHEIAACQTVGAGAPAAVAESVIREQVLDCYLGDLGNGELSLRSVWPADDVRQGHSSGAGSRSGRRSLKVVVLEMRLHRGQSRGRVVLERQVPEAGELIAGERSQARRVSGSGDGSVVGSRRQRVVGKGWRRGSRRVGGVGPRPLGVSHSTRVVVVVGLIVGVRARHVVRGERWEVASGAVHSVAVVGVVTRVVVRRSSEGLTLNLSSGLGQHGNVTTSVVVNSRDGKSKCRVRVGRRDIGGGQSGCGSRADGLGSGRRRHHSIGKHVRREALLLVHLMLLLLLVLLSSLVASPRVRVVVNTGVAGELIRARELLAAAGELAGMRLLASVSADVSSLMLETVEGLVAERALVRSRQLVGAL